jgi:hypothetical protein
MNNYLATQQMRMTGPTLREVKSQIRRVKWQSNCPNCKPFGCKCGNRPRPNERKRIKELEADLGYLQDRACNLIDETTLVQNRITKTKQQLTSWKENE